MRNKDPTNVKCSHSSYQIMFGRYARWDGRFKRLRYVRLPCVYVCRMIESILIESAEAPKSPGYGEKKF